jgi:tail tube protein gp19
MPAARTTPLANFMLTLDGVACGLLGSCVGGDIAADVIEERVDGSPFAKKHIGQPKYEDFELQVGFGMASPVYDWISTTWTAGFARKSGSVTAVDSSMNALFEQQFANALLTKTTIPALDAASKDAGRLAITLSPESTTTVAGGGKVPSTGGAQQKPFVLSHFRLELDGLDCSHVTKIDSFTVEVQVDVDPAGIVFPDLRVTMAADGAAAATWQSWFTDFVIDGRNEDGLEKSGAIVFLAPDLQGEIARVALHNVGISALRRVPVGAGDALRHLAADLYCERMELTVGTAPPVPPLKIPTPTKLPLPPGRIVGGIPR